MKDFKKIKGMPTEVRVQACEGAVYLSVLEGGLSNVMALSVESTELLIRSLRRAARAVHRGNQ